MLDIVSCTLSKRIQIQHLLKLNKFVFSVPLFMGIIQIQHLLKLNLGGVYNGQKRKRIQIQHLLKLNARKINLYDFNYTIKSIDTQGF